MSPGGSEVSQLLPKVLSEMFVLPNKSKTEKIVSVSGSDSDSDSDARRPQFNARGQGRNVVCRGGSRGVYYTGGI